MTQHDHVNRPPWIRGKLTMDATSCLMAKLARERSINSVCVEAACPNRGECWARGHVTFLILGRVCTRNCDFCNVEKGKPEAVDPDEPREVARFVKDTDARYVVITSVTRDDLDDMGAGHFINTVRSVKGTVPDSIVELLVPDMRARKDLIADIARSGAAVIGHNIEMPEVLYPEIRPGSSYVRSITALSCLADERDAGADILVKSSIVVGLGEEESDIVRTFRDLRNAGVDILFIGQYLSPSRDHRPVARFYSPEEFEELGNTARDMGFGYVASGPMVRSSFRAEDAYLALSVIQ
ncbi:MAG: lipoyl synthase [Candidatus Omnitrophica bacterium]|nr:lipoyl synthase [Candidatus Omnitrophota bacterium]MDD5487791.1 lipoyl synthase [Candidatus Omnitrophota bacterium]